MLKYTEEMNMEKLEAEQEPWHFWILNSDKKGSNKMTSYVFLLWWVHDHLVQKSWKIYQKVEQVAY